MLDAGIFEGADGGDQSVAVRTVVLGRFRAVHHERDPRQRPEHQSNQEHGEPRNPAWERLQPGPDVHRLAVRTGGHEGWLAAESWWELRKLTSRRRCRWGSGNDP
jgi:hypothetical protein